MNKFLLMGIVLLSVGCDPKPKGDQIKRPKVDMSTLQPDQTSRIQQAPPG